MRVVNRAGLSPAQLASVEEELPEHNSLRDVVNWGLAQAACTPQVVAEVVVQDEFSHDVIVPWRDGLFLVYGTT